jgi:hypothetical protein
VAIDERTRHEMYSGLEEKLGASVADALMAHLPPVGWADVATKQDLEAVNRRLDELHRLVLWLFSTQIALVGLVFTVAFAVAKLS